VIASPAAALEPADEPLPLKLVVISGPDFGLELMLSPGAHRIGSAAGDSLRLSDVVDPLIVQVDGAGRAEAQASHSTVVCDGAPSRQFSLRPGMELWLGQTVLRVIPVEAPLPRMPPSARERFGELIGKTAKMKQLFALLERAMTNAHPLLIEGETGIGKRLCARALHEKSPRSSRPFVVYEATGQSTAESVLRSLEVVGAGTWVLRGPSRLSPEVQAVLSRVLREGVEGVPFHARCIALSDQDLRGEARMGRINSELFSFFAQTTVVLPPLRARKEDIDPLLNEMLAQLNCGPDAAAQDIRALLKTYSWPGNVRELRYVLEKAVRPQLRENEDPGQLKMVGPEHPAHRDARFDGHYQPTRERLIESFQRSYLERLMKETRGRLDEAVDRSGMDRLLLQALIAKHQL
jgi:DNA-binding NtrC family response regulator